MANEPVRVTVKGQVIPDSSAMDDIFVQGDRDAQVIQFTMDKYVNGVDISTGVNYVMNGLNARKQAATGAMGKSDGPEEDTFVLTWRVGSQFTAESGRLILWITATMSSGGNVTFNWQSKPKTVYVKEGFLSGEYIGVTEQLLVDIATMLGRAEQAASGAEQSAVRSDASAEDAARCAANASASEAEAHGSAAAAAADAAAASASKEAAAQSAGEAEGFSSASGASAEAAQGSEEAAAAHAAAALQSEQKAKTSERAAAQSEADAAVSEQNASDSETVARNAANIATAASLNPPYIGENNNFYTYDMQQGQYVDTGKKGEAVVLNFSADALYAFYVNAAGHLILLYDDGAEAPNFRIDPDTGHLIYTFVTA